MPSSVWPLLIYHDSWTYHSRFLCNNVLYSIGKWWLPSPVTYTTGCCFHFGSASSLLLELFFHSSLVAYWAPPNLGSSSLSIRSFCLLILFMGFPRKEYWSGLPLTSPVDHLLSELSTMTCLSWVALHGMAHSFIELDKTWAMWSVWLVSYDYGFHSVCPLMDKDKRLVEASWREGLAVAESGSFFDGHRRDYVE